MEWQLQWVGNLVEIDVLTANDAFSCGVPDERNEPNRSTTVHQRAVKNESSRLRGLGVIISPMSYIGRWENHVMRAKGAVQPECDGWVHACCKRLL